MRSGRKKRGFHRTACALLRHPFMAALSNQEAMRKSDKKLDKIIVTALTDACENDLKGYAGFQWLTHIVSYASFPDSLSIICVFDTKENLIKITGDNKAAQLKASIEAKLLSYDMKIKDIKKRIVFDTEEACEQEHGGNWNKRFEGLQYARHA